MTVRVITNRFKTTGRGALGNPVGRFESISYASDPLAGEWDEEERPAAGTHFLKDASRSIISRNDSPDIPFDASVNPYRGCEHGCVYCYARPTHEYLGFSAGLDFESKILVKEKAPELLRNELASPKWKPQVIAMSGVTDCYQPIERHLQLTRRCLEVLAAFRNPVVVITKNFLVTRDADILRELAHHRAAAVYLSITTLDDALRLKLEPRTSSPARRLEAIRVLAAAQIPVGVLISPVIPGLNDHEIPKIIQASVAAGARFAAHMPVRLPYGVKDLFEQWLQQHFPDRKQKVLNRIRALKGGRLNDPRFGHRMQGSGIFAAQIEALFKSACQRAGILGKREPLLCHAFRVPDEAQRELFK